MSEHYYTSNPQSAHKLEACRYQYRGEELTFMTDAGVFSRGEVDNGTDALLKALPEELTGDVLDLGCGWGAISVTVAKKWPGCKVTACDVNERALGLTADNAGRNGVQVQTVISDGLTNIQENFDCILTNPPIRAGKQVIYRMFAECRDHLRENGSLVLVIRKQQGAPSAIKYLSTLFASVECIDKSGGFWVICCQKGLKA